MKLKPQPRPARSAGRATRHGAHRVAAKGRGRQASRPGVPIRRRFAGRLPSIRRLLAGVASVAAVAGLVALLNGPWLRVHAVEWSGGTYTPDAEVSSVLEQAQGQSALAVDTGALGARLEDVPSVADAQVTTSLSGTVSASVTEKEVAVVWDTERARFLVAADGTAFAALAPDGALNPALAAVPRIGDERASALRMAVGDEVGDALLAATLRVLAIDPALLGSSASALTVRLDDEFGFRLVAVEAGWEAALGVYGTDPRQTEAEAAARLERQVTALRTLFASRPESDIGWVDVRNPGKVYFRAKG